jgi:hypothetical protein
LQFVGKNTFGIGAKVISYAKGKSNLKNCKRQEGFNLHLNRLFILYGKVRTIDSLVVVWPDNIKQLKSKTNQTLIVKASTKKVFDYRKLHPSALAVFKSWRAI